MATKDFKLPDLGEGVHEGQIVRLMVKAGDMIREDQPLMEVETDKASVEIPSPFSGTVAKWHVEEGQLVHVGDVMVTVGDGAACSASPSDSRRRHAARFAPSPRSARPSAARAGPRIPERGERS